ncbi:MAG: DUF1570 domain-containing protein [Pirellulales bacterium]|nr:DUF1570 domain-containing protein [Pirellulales bacterium]
MMVSKLNLPGYAQTMVPRLRLPDAHSVVREQLVIHSDFPLPAHHRLLDELVALRVDLSQKLLLPISDEPIHVYLFDDAKQFQAFMRTRHPTFADRRAFFAESDTRLEVYAQWGDRVAEDLRHEVTHGYLHSVMPSIPLWLDEGLAEYFEIPRGRHGLNQMHVDELAGPIREKTWRPDLARLESLPGDADMSQADYAQSWAWAHFLLETHPGRRELLRDYVRALRQYGSVQPLSMRLSAAEPGYVPALVEHVGRLTAKK